MESGYSPTMLQKSVGEFAPRIVFGLSIVFDTSNTCNFFHMGHVNHLQEKVVIKGHCRKSSTGMCLPVTELVLSLLPVFLQLPDF